MVIGCARYQQNETVSNEILDDFEVTDKSSNYHMDIIIKGALRSIYKSYYVFDVINEKAAFPVVIPNMCVGGWASRGLVKKMVFKQDESN